MSISFHEKIFCVRKGQCIFFYFTNFFFQISDDEIVREYHVTSQPQQQPPAPSSFKIPSTSSLKNTRNPVIDRLMGHGDHAASASSSVLPSNLRNESYYMATGGSHHGHDVTWNGSMLQNNILFPPEGITSGHQNPNSGGSPDSVFIEQPPIITASASTQSVDNDDDTTVTGGDDHVVNTKYQFHEIFQLLIFLKNFIYYFTIFFSNFRPLVKV